MKKLILSAFCLLPLGLMAQDFTVKGKVGNLNEPAKAFLTYRVGSNSITDSAALVNGAFEFKGTVEGPVSASIRVKHDAAPVDPKKRVPADIISLYLENATINIAAKDSIKYASITGSKVNDDNAKFKALFKNMDAEVATLMKEYNGYTNEQKKDTTFMKPFMVKYNAANKDREPFTKKFAEENTNSYIGLVAFRSSMGYDFDPKAVEAQFLKYPAEYRASALGKNIANTIDGAKKTQVGVQVANFIQNDRHDRPVRLTDFRGSYVLVDFWASWCGPCRAENPNVVEAYNKFRHQGFTVLGVSLDQPGAKDAWLKAVEDDKLYWTQVSDLKFWDNAVSKSFGVQGIPFNFLLDPNGKIVARNIRGEELQTKLAEIIGKKKQPLAK